MKKLRNKEIKKLKNRRGRENFLFSCFSFFVKNLRVSTTLLAVFIIVLPFATFAQGLVPCGGEGDPCTICDLGVLGIRIINFFVQSIAIPLAGLMIVVGGVMIMFGAAAESRVTAGKKILTNAIIGLVIVFASWLLVDTVIKVLTGNVRNFNGAIENFGPWNELPSGTCNL